MSIFFLSLIMIIALLISTYGWGLITVNLTYGNIKYHWSFLAALGLACWSFLGGILNLSGLAYAGSLYIVLAIGICSTFIALTRYRTKSFALALPKFTFDIIIYILSVLIILGISIFLIATLMPANVFNFGDDFTMYLARPFQMLQTGSLGGNPFDTTGIESLGTQSFLQSFILMLYPAEYVNGLDTVLCFLLTSSLLFAIAHSIKAHSLYLLISLLALIFINPQIVNISPLYSISTMILGMLIASSVFTNSSNRSGMQLMFINTIPFALFVSSLISLKMTLVVFAVSYCLIYFTLNILFSNHKKQFFLKGLFLIVLVIVFLIPWVGVYGDKYWHIFVNFTQSNINESFTSVEFVRLKSLIGQLTSYDELFYEGRYIGYGFVIFLLLMAAVLSFSNLFKKNKNALFIPHLIVVFASSSSGIISYLFNVHFFDPDTSLRYSLPVFIAVLPYAALILGSYFGVFQKTLSSHESKIKISQFIFTTILCVSFVVLFILFWNTLLGRATNAYSNRSLISFPAAKDRNYIEYNKRALSNDTRNLVRGIQDKTDKGQAILAWISVPFHIDYTRNKIYTLTALGLFNPGLNMPLTGNPEDLRAYLKNKGVRYVMWEWKLFINVENIWRAYLISPYPVYRKIAENNLYFIKTLLALGQISKIIYNNNGTVLFDLR